MLIFTPVSLQASQVIVTIDGRQVNFTDQGPTIVNDRTLVPVRGVFEELGFEVDWEQDTQTARLISSSHEVVLTIGSANFITNGESHTLDVPAQIIGERTMLPIRAVLESVGYSVDWDVTYSDDSGPTTGVVRISTSVRRGSENRNIFSKSDAIDENGFWKGIEALNYVEIFDYNNLEIPNDVHRISDIEIEQEIEFILLGLSYPRIMDRAVTEGDIVNIDYIVFIDGDIFEIYRNVDVDMIFGDSDFLDEIVEQLIGNRPGDTVNVEVTIPDDYFDDIAGNDALFVTTINYIVGLGASELTSEHVLENLYEFHGWRTVSDMEEWIRRELQEWAIIRFVSDFIMNEVNVSSIPEKLMWYLEQVTIGPYKEIAADLGYTMEELAEMLGYESLDELMEWLRERNMEIARRDLVLQAVAEHGGFSVSREDIEDFFEEIFGLRDYDLFEEELPYITKLILQQKVLDHIVENAVLL